MLPNHEMLSWQDVIGQEKTQPYFTDLMAQLAARRQAGATIYPSAQDCFNAFRHTPFPDVKVVILGQDPYHGPGQAHGLCFSVQPHCTPPPSLKNMFKELHDDCGLPIPEHGCLTPWAQQGVLLLNTVLTVERGQPQSHAGMGWERFTDSVIEAIHRHHTGVIFLLWGSHAGKKGNMIDAQKHRILKAPHPSPLSAHRGFLGCQHFSKANALLRAQGQTPIDWALPPAAQLG